MADDSVTIKISADGKELTVGFGQAKEELKKFREQAAKDAQATADAWKKASEAVGKTMAGFGAGVLTGFAGAGKIAGDFQANMSKVNAVAKLSKTELKALSDQVIELSNDTKKGRKDALDLSDALENIYSRGLKGADAMTVLEQSTTAATAGMTSTKTAAQAIGQTMQAYGLHAKDAAKVTDILFKTFDLGAVSFEDLATAFPTVSVKAAEFGVSLEEASTGLAILTRTMPNAAEASTALEKVITQLAAPTAESRKELKALGIETGTTALQKKGLIGVMLDLVEKTRGLTSEQRKALSSSEALTAAMVLTKNAGADFKAGLAETRTAVGSTSAAFREMTDNTKANFEELKKQSTNLAIQIGESVLPAFDYLIDKGKQVVTGLGGMEASQKQAAVGFGAVTGAASLLGGGLFLLAPQIAAVPQAMATGKAGVLALKDSFLALRSSILLIPGALAIAGLALNEYIHNMERLNEINNAGIAQDSRGTTDYARTKKFIGKTPQEAASMGATKKDIEDLIRGLQELAQYARDNGSPAHAALYGGQIAEAMKLKDALPKVGRASLTPVEIPKKPTDTRNQVDPSKEPPDKADKADKESLADKQEKLALALQREARKIEGSRLGDGINQCANGVRLLYKKIGIILPEETSPIDRNLVKKYAKDKGQGPAYANSLYGPAVGETFSDKKNARVGDIVIVLDNRGIAEHVGAVTGPGKMTHNSRSAGHVMHTGNISDFPEQNLRFVRPYAFGSKRDKMSGYDPTEDFDRQIAADRQKVAEAMARFGDEFDRQIAELEKTFNDAIKVASPAEAAQLLEAKNREVEKLRTEQLTAPFLENQQASSGAFQRGLASASSTYQSNLAVAQTMPEDTQQEKAAKIQAEREITEARLADIQRYRTAYKTDGEAGRAQSQQWAQDEAQLKATLRQQDAQQMADARVQYEQDLEFKKAMGLITAQDYLTAKQNEFLLFKLTEEQKRDLILQTHDLQQQLAAEQGFNFGAVTQQMQSSFQGFLSGAIGSQTNFNQAFSNLWKAVGQQVLQELGQMIIRALALQKILSAIFNFFGFGGFGIASPDIISGAGGFELPGIPGVTAHTGGLLTAGGGLQKFHSGGGVGWDIRPDEVFALLQVGEAVLSRDQVAQARRGSSSGRGSTTNIGQVNSYGTSSTAVARDVGREVDWQQRALR